MASSQSLNIDQRIGLRLSQQQLRFVRLLELNTPELEEAVERELEDNPALVEKEEDFHEDERYGYYEPLNQRKTSAVAVDIPVREAPETLYEHLSRQLSQHDVTPLQERVAEYIIGSLDTNGYLRRPLDNIVDDLAFGPGIDITVEEAEKVLGIVQSLDPPGVGAKDLQECLLIQLEALPPDKRRDNALRIIREAFLPFSMKHRHKIISMLKLDQTEVDDALALILSLNPKPGSLFSSTSEDAANVVIPDFIVNVEDGNITISLNNSVPELKIDRTFEEAMAGMERHASGRLKKGNEFVVSRFNEARDFIKILHQRQETMMAVMTAIVNIQKEYFLTEDIYRLKPMIIKNISAMTGLDISVISRATANKFVATPWGIFPLRFFFSDSIGKENENSDVVTNRKIEAEIESLVEAEDKKHPLSDKKIMEEMAARGYEISRRTVAKYRDRIGIPVARLRKKL